MAKCKICGKTKLFWCLKNGTCISCLNNISLAQNKTPNIVDDDKGYIKLTYNHNLKKDKYYYQALSIYDEVISAYKKLIDNFSYKEYSILPYEKVFVIEDSFIIFIGLTENNSKQSNLQKDNTYRFFYNSIDMLYHIHMEELTSNDLFKFIGTKFTDQFDIDAFNFFNIKRFVGENNPYGRFGDGSVFNYVCSKLPKLDLHQRYLDWTGYLYHFIIYEIASDNNRTFCIFKTRDNNPNKIAISKINTLEHLVVLWRGDFNYSYDYKKLKYKVGGFSFNDDFRKISSLLIESIKNSKTEFNLYGKIKFCIVKEYIKELTDLDVIAAELFKQAVEGKFDNISKIEYTKIPIKWKSEYLVKELCEKLYGKNNVIYQHRPYFLHSDKGQLSYDIYLPKKKIAIEYQGKQHFESVEYFGGTSAFEKQQERDLLKKQLSEQNNVKLIYINYNDPITQEFISQKVKEVLT